MKRYVVFTLGLALASAADASIIFRAEPPSAPMVVPAVQVAPTRLSQNILLRRADAFGMKSPSFVKSPRGLVLQAGTLLLMQDANGAELFADTARMMAETPGEAPPMLDSEATKLATSLLRMTPRVDMTEVVLDRVRHLNNRGMDLIKGAMTDPTVDESIVVFNRQIEKIPVIPTGGGGEHLSIHLDNFGHMTGQRLLWRNAQMVKGEIPILPYLDVRDSFVRRLTLELGTRNDAIVTRIEFGLFSRPEGQPQGWMQPAYLFQVELVDPEMKQTTGARRIVVPAADARYLREPLELPLEPLEQGSPSNIRFRAPRPTVPTSATPYAITPNVVNADTLQMRATKLGLGTGTLTRTPRGMALKAGKAVVLMDEAGAESYVDTGRFLAEDPGAIAPQSDSIVLGLSREYISMLGDMDGAELGKPVVRRLYQQTFDIEKQQPGGITLDEAIVEYPRQFVEPRGNTIPCIGEGAYFNVHFDNAGKPAGHRRMWRQIGAAMKVAELRPYANIEADFVRHLASELGGALADVVGIQYGLYFRPEGYQQDCAQPAVLFDVDLLDVETGAVTGHRRLAFPAAFNPMEPLDDPGALLDRPAYDNASFREMSAIPATYGDLTKDGLVNTADVAMALQIAGGVLPVSDAGVLTAGDVYPAGFPGGDQRITLGDALRIVRSVYGLGSIADGP